MAEAYHRAVTMPREERRARMQALRRRVMRFDVQRWARVFIDAIGAGTRDPRCRGTPSSPQALAELMGMMTSARSLVLLLDYDGCLVPFAPIPDLAAPDRDLLALLARSLPAQAPRSIWSAVESERTSNAGSRICR